MISSEETSTHIASYGSDPARYFLGEDGLVLIPRDDTQVTDFVGPAKDHDIVSYWAPGRDSGFDEAVASAIHFVLSQGKSCVLFLTCDFRCDFEPTVRLSGGWKLTISLRSADSFEYEQVLKNDEVVGAVSDFCSVVHEHLVSRRS